MKAESSFIHVEVAYARPGEQIVLSLRLPEGARIGDAIRGSGILERCPEIELEAASIGIFGRLAPLETPLRDRDRVEIYRPLVAHARTGASPTRGGKAGGGSRQGAHPSLTTRQLATIAAPSAAHTIGPPHAARR